MVSICSVQWSFKGELTVKADVPSMIKNWDRLIILAAIPDPMKAHMTVEGTVASEGSVMPDW